MQTIDHFEVQARTYEEHAEGRPEFEERFRLRRCALDRRMPGGEGAPAVDFGCGPGHLTHASAARGFRTISIDGEAMLARPAAPGGKSAGHDVRRILAELEHGPGYVE